MGAGGRILWGPGSVCLAEPSRRVNTVPAVAARGFPEASQAFLGESRGPRKSVSQNCGPRLRRQSVSTPTLASFAMTFHCRTPSGHKESNQAAQGRNPLIYGAPEEIRTPDPQIRSLVPRADGKLGW